MQSLEYSYLLLIWWVNCGFNILFNQQRTPRFLHLRESVRNSKICFSRNSLITYKIYNPQTAVKQDLHFKSFFYYNLDLQLSSLKRITTKTSLLCCANLILFSKIASSRSIVHIKDIQQLEYNFIHQLHSANTQSYLRFDL